MKINWKLRFQNPLFVCQVLLSILVPILGYMGLTMQDMTTWGALFEVLKQAILNPYCVLLIVISVYNCVVDFTTLGVNDSHNVIMRKKLK